MPSSPPSRLVTALLALAAPAAAETAYPTHPIQVVVPFVAGGNTDLIMRVLADEMAAAMGQPVTVITKPGAGTNIGAAFVAASEPDGYTLLITPPAPLAINEYLYPVARLRSREVVHAGGAGGVVSERAGGAAVARREVDR